MHSKHCTAQHSSSIVDHRPDALWTWKKCSVNDVRIQSIEGERKKAKSGNRPWAIGRRSLNSHAMQCMLGVHNYLDMTQWDTFYCTLCIHSASNQYCSCGLASFFFMLNYDFCLCCIHLISHWPFWINYNIINILFKKWIIYFSRKKGPANDDGLFHARGKKGKHGNLHMNDTNTQTQN